MSLLHLISVVNIILWPVVCCFKEPNWGIYYIMGQWRLKVAGSVLGTAGLHYIIVLQGSYLFTVCIYIICGIISGMLQILLLHFLLHFLLNLLPVKGHRVAGANPSCNWA